MLKGEKLTNLKDERMNLRDQTSCGIFSVPIPRHKSRLSYVNIFLRHYGGKLETAVEQEVGVKIGCKR